MPVSKSSDKLIKSISRVMKNIVNDIFHLLNCCKYGSSILELKTQIQQTHVRFSIRKKSHSFIHFIVLVLQRAFFFLLHLEKDFSKQKKINIERSTTNETKLLVGICRRVVKNRIAHQVN